MGQVQLSITLPASNRDSLHTAVQPSWCPKPAPIESTPTCKVSFPDQESQRLSVPAQRLFPKIAPAHFFRFLALLPQCPASQQAPSLSLSTVMQSTKAKANTSTLHCNSQDPPHTHTGGRAYESHYRDEVETL